MKTFSSIIFLLSIFSSLSAQWHFHNPIPQGNTLYDVRFFNASMGWAVGDGGTILHTTDGGASWDRVDISSKANLYSVVFVDADLGFTCGSDGVILRTLDGGATWEDMNSGTSHTLRDIKAELFPVVMAAGDAGTVVFSENGGLTWAVRPTGMGARLNSLWCVNTLES